MVPSPHPYEERGTPTLGTLLPLAQAVKETQKHCLFPAPLWNHKMLEGICVLGLLWVLGLLFSHDYQGPQPPVGSSRACGLAVVGYVPPLGPKSKGLHLVGGPQSILQYQLMEGRGLSGELLRQVARSEGEPLAPDLEGSEYLTDGATPEQKARQTTQPTYSFTDEGTGVQRARSLFLVSCPPPGFPSWVSGEKAQSTFSCPTSFSMKQLSEPTLLTPDLTQPGSHSPPSG